MRIKSVRVMGFKRFSDLKIVDLPEAAKLVIVAGPNGNGKSSLFESFHAFHHRSLSELGFNWQLDYHIKKTDFPQQSDGTIEIQLFPAIPSDQLGRRKAFYVRSAYRNDPDFRTRSLERVGSALDVRRIDRLADNDVAVGDNYRRIASQALAELYDTDHKQKTYGDFQTESLGSINKYLGRLFPSLSLTSLGAPLEDGSFFFTKGVSKNFPYKNLSGGEKAAFDLILDLVVKRREFNDTVFVIDEPETHLNPRLHGELLRILFELVPSNCQIWLGTHAIGMLRAARDLAATSPEQVIFLDFDGDFDQPQTLKPIAFSRHFWEKSLAVAIDDLAALVAPRLLVRCEGSAPRPGDGFDAKIYENIFEQEFHDVRFLSSGSSTDLDKDLSVLTAAVENKIAGLKFVRLYDRDDRSDQEIADITSKGDRVLKRRHIESYLYDDEILLALADWVGKSNLGPAVLSAKAACVANLPARQKPADDVKAAAGAIFVETKKLLGITQGGNTARAFMRDTLAPLVRPDTSVYAELKRDIFSQASTAAQ